MAFTSTDLANIEAAITAFSMGTRASQVSKGDGMIKYADLTLSDLLKLRAVAQQDLGLASSRTYAKQGGRSQ